MAVGREKLGGREQGAPVLDIRRRADDLLHLLMGSEEQKSIGQSGPEDKDVAGILVRGNELNTFTKPRHASSIRVCRARGVAHMSQTNEQRD